MLNPLLPLQGAEWIQRKGQVRTTQCVVLIVGMCDVHAVSVMSECVPANVQSVMHACQCDVGCAHGCVCENLCE